VDYVGWLDEILELDYRGHCVIVLLCSWIKSRKDGVNASVKRDEYGFIVAKIPTGQIPVGPDSFAFPINVQQVFFADNDSHRNWKVVCRVDVRSRRSALQFAIDDSDVLHIGRDADFVGLSREFGNNNVFHGVIPDPEVVYIPEMRQ
jgi:hypothetical protein